MKRRHLIPIALLAAAIPLSASAAPAHMNTSVMLHVTKAFKGMAGFKHVTADATLKYTKHDVTIKITADNLPNPRRLGEKYYVLFATDGAMTDRVGVLHGSGNMTGLQAMVMMSKVTDLYVYAVSSATEKHPMGKQVLSAMV